MMPALAIAQLPKLPGLQQLVSTPAREEEVHLSYLISLCDNIIAVHLLL